jgi:dTDP-4-dehydrorhamnose 3,5-epimerase-like enzyme
MTDASHLPVVGDLSVVTHRTFRDPRGSLVPIEVSTVVPFPIARMFWVFDVPAGHVRGGHAHRLCSQYLLCIRGAIEVFADDGETSATLVLEAGCGLLIPPAIWASERYLTTDTALLVLCDRAYEVEDYIDSKDEVRAFRNGLRQVGQPS